MGTKRILLFIAGCPNSVHFGKLTWNLKRGLLKRIVVYKRLIFKFHVSFPECTQLAGGPRRLVKIFWALAGCLFYFKDLTRTLWLLASI